MGYLLPVGMLGGTLRSPVLVGKVRVKDVEGSRGTLVSHHRTGLKFSGLTTGCILIEASSLLSCRLSR